MEVNSSKIKSANQNTPNDKAPKTQILATLELKAIFRSKVADRIVESQTAYDNQNHKGVFRKGVKSALNDILKKVKHDRSPLTEESLKKIFDSHCDTNSPKNLVKEQVKDVLQDSLEQATIQQTWGPQDQDLN